MRHIRKKRFDRRGIHFLAYKEKHISRNILECERSSRVSEGVRKNEFSLSCAEKKTKLELMCIILQYSHHSSAFNSRGPSTFPLELICAKEVVAAKESDLAIVDL